MTRGALILAIAWAALAIQPAASEVLKVAGVAALAALLATSPATLTALLRQPALVVSMALLLLSSSVALEPAVWIGSSARAQGALLAAALIALAAAASRLSTDDRDKVMSAVAMLGGVVSCYVLIQRAGLDPLSWQGVIDQRPSATLSNATTLAGWLVLVLPVTIACALTARPSRGFWIALALLQSAALLASGTRSAVAALALAGIGALLLSARRLRRLGFGLLVVAVVAVALLAVWRPASLQDRSYLWRTAISALQSSDPIIDLHGRVDPGNGLRPWLGYGLDQQQPALAAAALATPGRRPEAAGWSADRAHQGLLDRALEQGVAGLIAGLLLVLAVARALYRGWRSGDRGRSRQALVLAVALAAWLVHLQASFALSGDRTLAWVWIGLAFALGERQPSDPAMTSAAAPNGRHRFVRTLAMALGVLLLGGALAASGLLPPRWSARLAPALQAEREFVAGQDAFAQARVTAGSAATDSMHRAAVAFERCVELRPHDLDAAVAAASARVELANLSGAAADLARAQQWADRVRRLAPADARLGPIDARIAAVGARLQPDDRH